MLWCLSITAAVHMLTSYMYCAQCQVVVFYQLKMEIKFFKPLLLAL